MKTISKYQIAKKELKETAEKAKKEFKNDKPLIRQIINEYTYILCVEHALTNYEENLLHNYACKLHP